MQHPFVTGQMILILALLILQRISAPTHHFQTLAILPHFQEQQVYTRTKHLCSYLQRICPVIFLPMNKGYVECLEMVN
jgi:uncharacterized membrane protein